jgi:DNA-binding beta-propeller fold protein YncE
MRFLRGALAFSLLIIIGACSSSRRHAADSNEFRETDLPGARSDGSVLLPNQWSLRPVGRQILLGDFPVNIAITPDGRYAAVLHSGNSEHEIVIVDLKSNSIVSRANVDESFYGLAYSGDGKQLFCSGAGSEVVHRFRFSNGYLGEPRPISLRDARERGIPSGLAVNRDGTRLFVANLLGHRLSYVDLAASRVEGETLFSTNGTSVFTNTAAVSPDEAAITKRAEAALRDTHSDEPFPYGCVLDEKRHRLYVSFWAQACVAVIDLETRRLMTRWATEEHPNEMMLSKSGRRLFVANANRNSVSVIDPGSGRTIETLIAELIPNAPPGNTPNSLALSPDEDLLFVANANINTVAVFDVAEPGKSRSLGFIPVGWYPTAVRVTPDGKKLLVANGKGAISKSNRLGPMPGREPPGTIREYIANLFQGTLSVIDLPARARFDTQLKGYTARAYACMPPNARTNTAPVATTNWNNPIPRRIGEPSPIKYVFYVIKENRTYDQVLGDMREGNGDPSICLFGENITPNHHALAREFVLLDNFYVESEVSADGHEWTMGAYATDFVEKTWPLTYGHNRHRKYTYPAEGNFPIATPAGGYLWDRAREARVTYRSYGEFVQNGKTARDPARTRVKALEGHFDPWFRGFDMDYPDVKRAERFISELRRFENEGGMPRLQIVRLPNDHTSGTASNKFTPVAHLAENDLALGMLVDAISHSKFWKETAIFVVEDDAQNGSDHVDAHRTVAFVISPYTRRRAVDSTMYSTSSMLRTMELILGLKPMSQFDATAVPMFNSFTSKPDFAIYKGLPARVDITERNQPRAPGARLSAMMDFSKEDAADDLLLNEVIWKSVKGADSVMPPPRRAAFVFGRAEGADDDDD